MFERKMHGGTNMQYPYPLSPQQMELAQAYVPFQYLTQLYPPMEGLERGTIFPELYKPYGADPEYLADQ